MRYEDERQRAYYEDTARYYLRAMNRAVERFGAARDRNTGPGGTLPENCVLNFKFASERDKWEAWCADSLAWACECIVGEYDPRASDVERARYVMRALLQASAYKGQGGNSCWPGSHFHDAAGYVQDWLERVALAPLAAPAARAA
jgi:hypothetical protein